MTMIEREGGGSCVVVAVEDCCVVQYRALVRPVYHLITALHSMRLVYRLVTYYKLKRTPS